MVELNGRCLCGDVTVKATAEKLMLRACHCDMCRRHTSGAFFSISNDTPGIEFSGPVKTYQSSNWAERGFCDTCGSTLFYGTTGDGQRHLAAGLFDGAAGAALKLEFFADNCPSGYALAGEHRKMSTAETIALFTGEGDDQ